MEIKIPLYNVLNMLLIGFVFTGGVIFLFFDAVIDFMNQYATVFKETGFEAVIIFCAVAIAYEVGLILNRIGSVLIEPILIKTKLITFSKDYKKFNIVKKANPIVEILSREYAVARSSIVLFLLLFIMSLIKLKYLVASIFLVIMVIFLLSAIKHSKKIVQLMQDWLYKIILNKAEWQNYLFEANK